MQNNWKCWILRAGTAGACLWLLFRIRYAAGGLFRVASVISERTYRTAEEQRALVLLCCVLFLLFSAFLSVALAAGKLAEESRHVRFCLLALFLFFFYVYACLYGYPLLDNHVTTAWLMTGQYTKTLLESLLRLLAGVFGKGFSWNGRLVWRMVCAALLGCPFVLLSAFVGIRNTVPVLLSALLPVFCFLTGEYCLFPGWQHLLLGAAACLLSAGILELFTDGESLGTEKKKKKSSALVQVAVDDRKRLVLMVLCALLWIVTVWSGRIRSFGAVMRLIFSSSVYSYQENLYDLADVRIAQAMILSYLLSLAVGFVKSWVRFEDDSRAGGVLTTLYTLLLNIWVMPVLSNFAGRAADRAQGALPGDVVRDTAMAYGALASDFLDGVSREHILLALLLTALAFAAGLAAVYFLARLPAVRLLVWFVVYFSACTFVYCLIGLYYRSPLGNWTLLMVCYALNYLLNRVLSSGERLRAKVGQRA